MHLSAAGSPGHSSTTCTAPQRSIAFRLSITVFLRSGVPMGWVPMCDGAASVDGGPHCVPQAQSAPSMDGQSRWNVRAGTLNRDQKTSELFYALGHDCLNICLYGTKCPPPSQHSHSTTGEGCGGIQQGSFEATHAHVLIEGSGFPRCVWFEHATLYRHHAWWRGWLCCSDTFCSVTVRWT